MNFLVVLLTKKNFSVVALVSTHYFYSCFQSFTKHLVLLFVNHGYLFVFFKFVPVYSNFLLSLLRNVNIGKIRVLEAAIASSQEGCMDKYANNLTFTIKETKFSCATLMIY